MPMERIVHACIRMYVGRGIDSRDAAVVYSGLAAVLVMIMFYFSRA
jgi:hypothetical protein